MFATLMAVLVAMAACLYGRLSLPSHRRLQAILDGIAPEKVAALLADFVRCQGSLLRHAARLVGEDSEALLTLMREELERRLQPTGESLAAGAAAPDCWVPPAGWVVQSIPGRILPRGKKRAGRPDPNARPHSTTPVVPEWIRLHVVTEAIGAETPGVCVLVPTATHRSWRGYQAFVLPALDGESVVVLAAPAAHHAYYVLEGQEEVWSRLMRMKRIELARAASLPPEQRPTGLKKKLAHKPGVKDRLLDAMTA